VCVCVCQWNAITGGVTTAVYAVCVCVCVCVRERERERESERERERETERLCRKEKNAGMAMHKLRSTPFFILIERKLKEKQPRRSAVTTIHNIPKHESGYISLWKGCRV
jgi:hypothetical protein